KGRGWNLDEIVNTHHHHDHIGGNAELLEIYKSKLIAPVYDKTRISDIDILVSDNDLINIAGTRTKVIHTPGHTLGHVCFYMADEKCLFSGDTLFYLGCGRVFEGTMEQMWLSLLKLRSLPNDTLVYCGHEYTSSNAKFAKHIDPNNQMLEKAIIEIKDKRKIFLPTIPFELGKEKIINPFLRADDQNLIDDIGLKTSNPNESFSAIRLKKDNF
ncbi:hydroxyacylglutathione hydrolase, partial [Alphaproteobacteria bacterium]|nr:hydroxyacylglutathione hydrolase [Alphaproteobacteria bacterium]